MLSCHGDERGILLPELGEEIAREEALVDVLTPERLSTFVHLPGRVVISTGCATGSEGFADVFLKGGCDYYIAPQGYPQGDAPLFFVVHFYYDLVADDRSVEGAFSRARDHDDPAQLFRLFSKEEVR